MTLGRIEKRILEIDRMLGDKNRENEVASAIITDIHERQLKAANKPLLEERTRLETERRFMLDKREGLFWRIIWNVVVPILVSVATVYILRGIMGA